MIHPDLARRVDLPELMDTTRLAAEELDGTLRFLETVNRRLGGYSLTFGYLERWLSARPASGPVTILDAGTGGGDLPVALAQWGRRQGLEVRVVGLDADEEIARWARRRAQSEPRVEIVHGELAALERTGRRFDFVTASLLLHHIPEAALVPVLRTLDGLAARGLVIGDLRRCAAGYVGVTLVTAALGNRVVRHDGPLSVRRAFLEGELEALAARAGLPHLRARRHPFFRLALAGEKS